VGFSTVTGWLEKNHVGATGWEWDFSIAQRCILAGRTFWFYPGKIFWPENLCFLYTRWKIDASSPLEWLYPVSAACAVAGVWAARKKIGRGPAAAILYYTGTVFPVMGFMNVYGMRYSFVWDHWAYLPSLGIIAISAAWLVKIAGKVDGPG